jgi:hypothetical protein
MGRLSEASEKVYQQHLQSVQDQGVGRSKLPKAPSGGEGKEPDEYQLHRDPLRAHRNRIPSLCARSLDD